MKSSEHILTFPRQIGKKRIICNTLSEFSRYLSVLSDKSSCYTSLYSFQRFNPDGKPDYSTAVIDRAWWDFDLGKNGVSIDGVKDDVHTLVQRIYANYPDSDVRIVATGRGFHVHQMFSETVSGVMWSSHLQRYEGEMGRDLRSLDGIGYSEKLTRITGTYNPMRKRWAVCIDEHEFMKNPHDYVIPKNPSTMPKERCAFFGVPVSSKAFSLVSWVKDNPRKAKVSKTPSNAFSVGVAVDVPIPPCINSLIKQPNPEHKARVFLVSEMAYNMRWFADPESLTEEQNKHIEDSITAYIESLDWLDYKESITREGVRSCMKLSNPPSCRSIERRGWCSGSCWRDDGTREI